MEPLRLRLKFDDSALSDSQKSDGLKRSWVLVEPGHLTIYDFAAHLLHAFDLWDSCPHGIFLSMDGFVLPHFESVAILNDNDLVCVKRKGSKLLVEEKVEEKLLLIPGAPLSANEEFANETGGYQSKTEEEDGNVQTDLLHEEHIPNGDASIKKIKALKQLKNSKCSNIENWEGTVTLSGEPDGTVKVSVTRSTRRKKSQRQRRRIAGQQLQKKQLQGGDLDDEDHPKESNQDGEPEDEVVPVMVWPGHIRFAAPGKAKDVQQYQEAEGSFNWHGSTNKKRGKKRSKEKDSPTKQNENKAANKKQPASKWNNCRSAQDKKPASKWKEHRSPQEKQSAHTWGGNRSAGRWKSGSKWNEYRTHGRSWVAQKAPPAKASKDYEKLAPMTDFPVQGDIIAYRLLGMSSSFCPELTSYRVGKVLSADPKSNMVVLVPVLEYPFEFNKATDDTSDELDDASRYKEDGSLEIDFPSLADVRIVSRALFHMANGTPASGWYPGSGSSWWTNGKLPSSQAQSGGSKWTGTSAWAPASGWGSTSNSGWRTETPGSSKDPHSQVQPSNNRTAMKATVGSASTSENGDKDVWEQVSAAVSAKKAGLLKEDNWNKKRKPANYAWSYRTLRSGTRGPNMASSSAQNGPGAK